MPKAGDIQLFYFRFYNMDTFYHNTIPALIKKWLESEDPSHLAVRGGG